MLWLTVIVFWLTSFSAKFTDSVVHYWVLLIVNYKNKNIVWNASYKQFTFRNEKDKWLLLLQWIQNDLEWFYLLLFFGFLVETEWKLSM